MYLAQSYSVDMWKIEQYVKELASRFDDGEELVEWCVENNVFDYTTIRNIAIREYYRALPNRNRYEAKLQTADHFCLSEAQIHRILFDKRYRKK